MEVQTRKRPRKWPKPRVNNSELFLFFLTFFLPPEWRNHFLTLNHLAGQLCGVRTHNSLGKCATALQQCGGNNEKKQTLSEAEQVTKGSTVPGLLGYWNAPCLSAAKSWAAWTVWRQTLLGTHMQDPCCLEGPHWLMASWSIYSLDSTVALGNLWVGKNFLYHRKIYGCGPVKEQRQPKSCASLLWGSTVISMVS